MSRLEELRQKKTDKELINKCNSIIDSLKGFNAVERYRILTSLQDSFMDVCKQEGISFIDIQKL